MDLGAWFAYEDAEIELEVYGLILQTVNTVCVVGVFCDYLFKHGLQLMALFLS